MLGGGLPSISLVPFYSERVLPLLECFFGLRECSIGRRGVGEEKIKVHGRWLGIKFLQDLEKGILENPQDELKPMGEQKI